MDRPWASALDRLLAERRGLKKGELAALAGVRAGTISAVANSPKPPDIRTLQAIADGLTRWDRGGAIVTIQRKKQKKQTTSTTARPTVDARNDKGNPEAPEVPLWEFFVSDEQSETLRGIATAKAEAVRKAQPATMADTMAQMQQHLLTLQRQLAEMEERQRHAG